MRKYFSRPPAYYSRVDASRFRLLFWILPALAAWLGLTASPVRAAVAPGPSSWGQLPLLVGAAIFILLLVGVLRKRFAGPLTNLERITRNMAACQLQELVAEESTKCRLTGRLGANINELALNLQEVLLLVWNLSRQDLEAMERITARLKREPGGDHGPVLADLDFIRQDLEEMQEIVRQFEFFNVVLQDEKLLAKPEPATGQEREG